MISSLRALNIPDSDRAAMFGGNAARLLGL